MGFLDNRLVAQNFCRAYYAAMETKAFRDRVIDALSAQNMSKAELSRRAEVPYHALDKFLKGISSTTSTENAIKISKVLGVAVDEAQDYEELKSMFYQLDEEQREALLKMVRGLVR